jgi:hypothetical protein
MYSRHPLGLKFQPPATQMDRGTHQALARSVNRIARTGGITRAVDREISANYVAAGQLASRSLTIGEHFASQAPQTDAFHAYFNAITERYLIGMLTVLERGNRALIRQSFGDDDQYDG